MSSATAPCATAEVCSRLEQRLQDSGPVPMLNELVAELETRCAHRELLDAMLLRDRVELGLPALIDGPPSGWPADLRALYEDRYVDAIRRVGKLLLDRGEILNAWPYFRLIGEREPVASALDAATPPAQEDELGQWIDVAFNQGAHPLQGFRWILEHFGACSAITAFDHLPPDEFLRASCATLLVRHLHQQLVASVRSDLAQRGQVVPPDGATLEQLLADRPWLLADEGYHIDLSHLAAVVRMGPLLSDPETLRLAADLAAYGAQVSPRLKPEGDPPFGNHYEDHLAYLRALAGQDVDTTAARFRHLLEPGTDPHQALAAAQALVRLLDRNGLLEEAIEVVAEHLSGVPESTLACPGLAELCRRAGKLDRLAAVARDRGELVPFAAALLASSRPRSQEP